VGDGIELVSLKEQRLKYVLQIQFDGSTNNVVEPEAILHGIRMAISPDIHRLYTHRDSELVINHVIKEPSCKDSKKETYY